MDAHPTYVHGQRTSVLVGAGTSSRDERHVVDPNQFVDRRRVHDVGGAVLLAPSYHSVVLRGTDALVTSFDREFESFFLQHFDAIVNSLTVITGDRDRATDATQEAFIKAYARWPKIRSYDLPAAWVRRIAINASRDTRRSERRRTNREEAHFSSDVASPSSEVVGLDFAVGLLAGLPRRQREVATLFYLEDCSVREVAETLRLSPGTVKFHLSEARERMRALIDSERVEQ